jgi:hypothetical protein
MSSSPDLDMAAGLAPRRAARATEVAGGARDGAAAAGREMAATDLGRVARGARRVAEPLAADVGRTLEPVDVPCAFIVVRMLEPVDVTGACFVTISAGAAAPRERDVAVGLVPVGAKREDSAGVDLVVDGARETATFAAPKREEDALAKTVAGLEAGKDDPVSLDAVVAKRAVVRKEVVAVALLMEVFAGMRVGSRSEEKKKGVSGVNVSAGMRSLHGEVLPSTGAIVSIAGTGVSSRRRSMSASVNGDGMGSSRVA